MSIELKRMTPSRAAYFMERFKREEKLLGPNEQAALTYVIDMLEKATAIQQAEAQQPATSEPVEAQCRFRRGKKDEVSDDVHLRAARLGFRPRSDAPCWKDVSADVRRDAARWRALVESGCELVCFRKGRRMLWAVRPCFTSYEYELFATPEQAIDAMLAAK